METIPQSHLPYWLIPTADKIRLILREKIAQWDYKIDMERLLYTFPKITREEALNIISWYEDGLLDTKFEIIN